MRHLCPILLIASLITTTEALSEDKRIVDAFHCTDVSNDIARLECFDKAYSDYHIAASAPGNWRTRTAVSPIDDTVTFAAVLSANKNSKPMFASNKLFIRCQGSQLELWVTWSNLIKFEGTRMTSRVGKDSAVTENWIEGAPDDARFYPGDTRKLVRKMMATDRFVVQLAEGKHKGEIAIFNIKGLKDASKPMQEACLPPPPLFDNPSEQLIQKLVEKMKEDPSIIDSMRPTDQ